MKVVLIYPYCLEDRIHADEVAVMPMGVYSIAALLIDRGHPTVIINMHDLKDREAEIRRILIQQPADVYGFSVLHANRWGAIDTARIIRDIYPTAKIVFGGPGATFLWRHLLVHHPEIDAIVMGEAEHTFLNLLDVYGPSGDIDLQDIAGIAWRPATSVDQPAVRCNPMPEPLADLDRLPNPAQYFTYQHVALTRGCPWNCTFCGSPAFWQRRVRFHSTGYFVDQLALLHQRGVTSFFVSDDTFTLQRERVIDVCREILARKLSIQWVAIARVSDVEADMLTWMRRAGCTQISFGVESGSQRIRKTLNKQIHTADIKRAFALTQSHGMLARAYFIYGCPGESWETIQETLDLMDLIQPLGAIFYLLAIFPGTALYHDYMARCGATDDIWTDRVEDILYFQTDPDLSQEDVLAFGQKLRSHFYRHLPTYADQVALVAKPELYARHADFLSRLALTFSHGDYSKLVDASCRWRLARRLYERALGYYPNQRAFLGLGVLYQRERRFEASVDMLQDGLDHFPQDRSLTLALGVSLINLGRFQQAQKWLAPFADLPEAQKMVAACQGQ